MQLLVSYTVNSNNPRLPSNRMCTSEMSLLKSKHFGPKQKISMRKNGLANSLIKGKCFQAALFQIPEQKGKIIIQILNNTARNCITTLQLTYANHCCAIMVWVKQHVKKEVS